MTCHEDAPVPGAGAAVESATCASTLDAGAGAVVPSVVWSVVRSVVEVVVEVVMEVEVVVVGAAACTVSAGAFFLQKGILARAAWCRVAQGFSRTRRSQAGAGPAGT